MNTICGCGGGCGTPSCYESPQIVPEGVAIQNPDRTVYHQAIRLPQARLQTQLVAIAPQFRDHYRLSDRLEGGARCPDVPK